MSSTSQSLVTQTTQGIVEELGNSAEALSDPAFYDMLRYDPALLAAVALSTNSRDGAAGLQQLIGASAAQTSNSTAATVPSIAAGPPSSTAVASSANATAAAPPREEEPHPDEEVGECPICFDAIHPGDAAMRCSGDGGVHHYFHARCLQTWIRSCRSGSSPSCPICRGSVQFNGRRLAEFLESPGADNLDSEERSFLESIADGLQHKNKWSDMSNVERGAYSVGLAAAAGWGFMLGYNSGEVGWAGHHANEAIVTRNLPREHQIAEGVGWVAGILARILREAAKDKSRDRRDRDRS